MMPEGLVIHKAERREFARCVLLWEGYNAFYEREGPTAISMEVTQLTWERFSMAMSRCMPRSRSRVICFSG